VDTDEALVFSIVCLHNKKHLLIRSAAKTCAAKWRSWQRQQSVTRSSATTEIARDADETAIQGHSRLFIVVPINAAYMASY